MRDVPRARDQHLSAVLDHALRRRDALLIVGYTRNIHLVRIKTAYNVLCRVIAGLQFENYADLRHFQYLRTAKNQISISRKTIRPAFTVIIGLSSLSPRIHSSRGSP